MNKKFMTESRGLCGEIAYSLTDKMTALYSPTMKTMTGIVKNKNHFHIGESITLDDDLYIISRHKTEIEAESLFRFEIKLKKVDDE